MSEEEEEQWAAFERFLSNQIVREVAKKLRIRIKAWPKESTPYKEKDWDRHTPPFIMRFYGERLIVPGKRFDFFLSVTVTREGKVHADTKVVKNMVGCRPGPPEFSPRCTHLNAEYYIEMSDPNLIDRLVSYCKRALMEGETL